MRALAVVILLGVVTGCAARIDVAAEDRFAVREPTIVTSLPTPPPTTPPLTTAPSTTQPAPMPPPTVPPPTVPVPTAPSTTATTMPPPFPGAETMLLRDGDLPGWEISEATSLPAQQYGPSTCQFVDALREVDNHERVMTQGASGGERFHNFVLESVDGEEWVIDAALQAPVLCGDFEDRSGRSTVVPLSVPAAAGWRSAGVSFLGATPAATIGYWQRGTMIVKLRVIGSNATSRFEQVGRALADKLARTPGSDDAVPEPAPAWQSDPLAPLVLDAVNIGELWTRTSVERSGAGPLAWVPGGCGIEEPERPVGLSANFTLLSSDALLLQDVTRSKHELAQQWVDTHRQLAATCSITDVGQRVSAVDVPSPASIGADDLVAVAYVGSEPDYPYVTNWLAVRFGDVYVDLLWTSHLDNEWIDEMPTLDDMLRLAVLSAPS